jgi:S1-C subfamily serine protease
MTVGLSPRRSPSGRFARVVPGLLAVAALLAAGRSRLAADPVDPAVLQAERQRIAVIDTVRPAVVAVFHRGGGGGGSGVLIDPEGYALTNFHVVEGAGGILRCGLSDGVMYDAVLVGLDKVGDVALIKLLPKAEGKKFPVAPLGNSDEVQAGDWTFAMGNPFLLATDFTPTVTYGVVSATHRYQYPAGTLLEYTDCIQVDTSINPGNSGGPLFNAKGELIGINGRISLEKRGRVNIGVGYSISINQIKNFLGQLYAGIETDHATLVQVESANQDGPLAKVTIKALLEDSDARRRGLEPGDELVSFAGRPIGSVNQYKNILGVYPKDWRLPLVYRRDEVKHETLVRLMPLQQKEPEEGQPKVPERPDRPDRPERPERPMPPGAPKPPPVPEALAKLYQPKPGYANYHFNEEAQKKLLAGFRKHGDFSTHTGDWVIDADALLRDAKAPVPAEFLIGTQKGAEGETVVVQGVLNGITYRLDPLKKQDLMDLQNPPGSGGLLVGLYHLRRMLTQGPAGFEGEFSHGGREPIYPLPLEGPRPDFKDVRVDADVLRTEHGGIGARWFFSPKDQTLLGMEVTTARDEDPCEFYFSDYRPVEGRMLPHKWEVRRGDDRYAVISVRRYALAAKR